MSKEKIVNNFHCFLRHKNLDVKKHQEEGLYWCVNKEIKNYTLKGNELEELKLRKGGIIADEMGLGKTILTLGIFASNFVRNTLIVVPLSLLNQWKNEIRRSLGHNVLIYYGKTKSEITIQKLKTTAIVLTTYGSLKPSSKENLYGVHWDRIIFDEAHHMRNSSSKKYFYGKLLKSKSIWLLTGTPVQNRKEDLRSLFYLLGYNSKILNNIDAYRELRLHHILRRKKSEVGLNMPPIHFHNMKINWINEYEKKISKNIHKLVHNKYSNSDLTWLNIIGDRKIIQMIRAKQVCISPKLIEQKIKHMIDQKVLPEEYEEISKSTTKIDSLISIIKKRKENKKLIFCSFHEEMKIIHEKLKQESIVSVSLYHGKLNLKSRQKIIEKNDNILIMQIQAGCEGLNLQNYNEIYILSPHWNPCVEDQAIGRCYRIGQKKETHVFHFNMEELENEEICSMDQYIENIQKEKRDIQKELI